jgi:formylmethanofuran dehydrogenase subunit B
VQAFRPADGDARDIIIYTAVAGIHEGGTAMRMDDVPLPLRTLVAGPAGAAEVARAIGRRLKELGRVSGQAAAR